jgi:hypothetical protein
LIPSTHHSDLNASLDYLMVSPVGEMHIARSGEGPVDPATVATTARHCCSLTIWEVTATSP